MDLIKIRKAALSNSNILSTELSQHYHCTPMTGRNSNQANGIPGGFCIVFPMNRNDSGSKIAFRVWYLDNFHHQQLQIARDVGADLPNIKLPYFVGYKYLEKAIDVEGNRIPGVRMEWVDGDTLDNYIKKHRSTQEIQKLAGNFLTMCRDVTIAGIAHGDLSNSNILVMSSGEIRLVDYDSLYLPSMAGKGYTQTTSGQPAFQHPQRRGAIPMSSNDDNFSQILIYLSLLAISHDTTLVDNIAETELLFNNVDLQSVNNFRNSNGYQVVSRINDKVVRTCLTALEKAIAGPLSAVPSLVNVLHDASPVETPKPLSGGTTYVVMFRNKNYCPMCGTKYPSERSAFCSLCRHPREVEKTW